MSNDPLPDRRTVERAAQRCMHLIMWAAGPHHKLEPHGYTKRADLKRSWSGRVEHAQVALHAEVADAAQKTTAIDECPGISHDASEVSAAIVGCAIMFEVLGSICGLLPATGWLRAHRLFKNLMVCTHV